MPRRTYVRARRVAWSQGWCLLEDAGPAMSFQRSRAEGNVDEGRDGARRAVCARQFKGLQFVAFACLAWLPAPVRGNGEEDFYVMNQRAVEHLQRGNDLALQRMHREAIEQWEIAASYRPDSNVPWNNMANSFSALQEPVRD